ncbi:MAG: ATP-binding protein [Myxococcota bacterium]|nr:Hpt domain-containing protein [Deltaproteobacteria bacterium]MDQ3335031.1 ATP-binding protein [Myxococcota bacterium]
MSTRPARKPSSIKRLRAMFMIALAVGLSLFTGVMFTLVDNLSERFGPEVREDLEWRALRGAHELARAADLGLAIGDRAMVTQSFGVYAHSPDVAAIHAIDSLGTVVAHHGESAASESLFTGAPDTLTRGKNQLVSWMPSVIEGHEVGKVAIVVSTRRLSEAQAKLSNVAWITLAAGCVGLLLGGFAIMFFTRAMASRDKQLNHYASNLEQMVVLRTAELDERNGEMRLVLDSVAQGFVMVDVRGMMASERSAIVDVWFGTPSPGTTFGSYIEPHAAEFAAWFELALSTLRDAFMPVDLCLAQMPKRFAVGGRAFEVSYRTIMEGERLDRVLIIISDVTAEIVRARSEREQRELLVMFQRITTDGAGVDGLLVEVKELLAILASPCDVVVERRILHTLKGNCALFGLELYSELCHSIESELADSLQPISGAQREALLDGWQTVASWIGRLRGAPRDNIVEIEIAELAQVIERAAHGISSHEIAAVLLSWTLEPVARRLERLAQHARGLARRLGKGELEVIIQDGGVRLDGAHWASFWSAAVHAIRNSIDHGLEHTDERVALGKPAAGCLTFVAEQAAGWTTVTFGDDGRGIDWDAIAVRARAAGMPFASHADLVAALFADGVTSREEVSETSGRGIGMAALQHAVTDLGGTIDIVTTRGTGTRISCRFPEITTDMPRVRSITSVAKSPTYTSKIPCIVPTASP